ncbi:MAG: VOC family protein, partial [Bacteroidota bacterium]
IKKNYLTGKIIISMQKVIDHLVVGANSLEEGLAYVKDQLGIDLPPGGKHPKMGTHNHLTKIGAGIFLEVIAIDPRASPPPYPRWFALDDPHQKAQLTRRPRLITWVVGTTNLRATLSESERDLGSIKEMNRGDLHWEIAFREDGSLAEYGLLPIFIQWPKGVHPANQMDDQGLRLQSLTLVHPRPLQIEADLKILGIQHLVEVKAGLGEEDYRLEATFDKEGTQLVLG